MKWTAEPTSMLGLLLRAIDSEPDESVIAGAMMRAGNAVVLALPPDAPFVLIAFPPDCESAGYVANCHRSDAIAVMRAVADRLEEGR